MTHCFSKTGLTGCMLMESYGPKRRNIIKDFSHEGEVLGQFCLHDKKYLTETFSVRNYKKGDKLFIQMNGKTCRTL